MKSSEMIQKTNAAIIDFETLRRRKTAKRWVESDGRTREALYSNLWDKDREIVAEFLQSPEGEGVTVPKLHLHPKRSSRLFISIHDMKDDVKQAFVEFVISKYGYEILSAGYTG